MNMADTDNMTAIDKAIAAAKARKAAKAGTKADGATAQPTSEEAPVKGAKKTKAKPTDADKAAAKAAKDAEREAKKAERDAARAAKKAERESARKPAHMSKVEKAASKLPALSDAARLMFNEITANATSTEVATLAAHLVHFNRAKATERALTQKLSVGDAVTIVSGDPRFIGMTGTVSKAQRIRCYVDVPGVSKPVYLFTSDVEVMETEQVAEAVSA